MQEDSFWWRNENFAFTIIKINIHFVISCDYNAVSSIQKIANFLIGLIRMICQSSVFLTWLILIGYCNKDFTSWEGIKCVINVSFDMIFIPNLILFSCRNQSLEESVNFRVFVHRRPKRFSIFGIISSIELLLSSIVNNRNSLAKNCVSKSTLKQLYRGIEIKESRIIMVIDKDSEDWSILERILLTI